MSSISLTQIKYVLAVEQTGSFSAAADMCFITQSTLSTMIKKLEASLDIELFDRKKKPIRLTEEGEKLITQFKVVYNESENLTELVQETKKVFFGTLHIGVIPTLAPYLLPLFLEDMVHEFPEIVFTVFEITTNEIIERIKLRELDVGILSLPILDSKLQCIPMYREEFVVYDATVSKSKNKKYKIKDIDVNRLWLLEKSHCMTNQIEQICQLRAQRKVNNNLIFESSSMLTLLNLIHENKGVTLLPKLATFQKNLINPSFIHPLESPFPVREIGLVIHVNFYKKRILKILQKRIKEAVHPKLATPKNVKVVKPF